MKYGRYAWSHLLMSWGLGATFLWIGLDMFSNSNAWIGFIPDPVPFGLAREVALQLAALTDIALGALLIMRWWQKWVALIAAAHLAAIIFYNGIDQVIIRDVGLLGTALALFQWPHGYKRRSWWRFWGKRRSGGSGEE